MGSRIGLVWTAEPARQLALRCRAGRFMSIRCASSPLSAVRSNHVGSPSRCSPFNSEAICADTGPRPMTQLSRPYQIALVTLALLVLVWFAALHGRRPSSGGGSGSSPAASSAPVAPAAAAEAKAAATPTRVYHGAAPGVEGLTRAIDKAHGAVAQSQREAHRVETSEPSASSSATTPASHTTTSAPAHPAAVKPARPCPRHAARGQASGHQGEHAGRGRTRASSRTRPC